MTEERQRAADERASQEILRSIHRAFREALRALPEKYDWFNLIVINNAHRDFVYASRNKVLKLRYLCHLYMKELVHSNFPGLSPERLLERMVELSLYTEEHLR